VEAMSGGANGSHVRVREGEEREGREKKKRDARRFKFVLVTSTRLV
jgi:hypothetical protein